MATYSYRDKLYSIVPCSKKDIPSHIERVLSYWKSTGTDIEKQQKLLEQCVDEGTAIQCISNNRCYGCLYWKPLNKDINITYFVWFKHGIVLGIGLDYIYKHTPYKKLCYVPHKRDKISYKSLLTNINIYTFFNTDNPITVDLHNHYLTKLYKKYFINLGIKEI